MSHIHSLRKHPFIEQRRKENVCDIMAGYLTSGFSRWKVFSRLSSREQQFAAPDITVTLHIEYEERSLLHKVQSLSRLSDMF